ncbi:MAG: SOS response-associated peptidase [Prevotellaceae bacterium]|nr:SOS response-associated peptidase [Prevotellaceae bacterium]
MEIARHYGRQPGIVEMAEQIIQEQKIIKAYLHPACLIVTHSAELQTAKWGLIPFWVRDVEKVESIRNMTANAKAETAFELSSFREAIKKRRCLIPSTGYFEYHHEGKEAIPYRIFLRDTEIFSLAGMYEEWRHPETKETIRTFSVLTVPANELCALIHNGGRNPGRMPAILPPENEKTWLRQDLTKEEVSSLLIPYDSSRMDACALEKDYLKRA